MHNTQATRLRLGHSSVPLIQLLKTNANEASELEGEALCSARMQEPPLGVMKSSSAQILKPVSLHDAVTLIVRYISFAPSDPLLTVHPL